MAVGCVSKASKGGKQILFKLLDLGRMGLHTSLKFVNKARFALAVTRV